MPACCACDQFLRTKEISPSCSEPTAISSDEPLFALVCSNRFADDELDEQVEQENAECAEASQYKADTQCVRHLRIIYPLTLAGPERLPPCFVILGSEKIRSNSK